MGVLRNCKMAQAMGIGQAGKGRRMAELIADQGGNGRQIERHAHRIPYRRDDGKHGNLGHRILRLHLKISLAP